MFDRANVVFGRLRRLIAPKRSAFVCGDCEQVNRCGLPPSDTCIVRLAQICRHGEDEIKRRKRRFEFFGSF
jgi:hypothetical protein